MTSSDPRVEISGGSAATGPSAPVAPADPIQADPAEAGPVQADTVLAPARRLSRGAYVGIGLAAAAVIAVVGWVAAQRASRTGGADPATSLMQQYAFTPPAGAPGAPAAATVPGAPPAGHDPAATAAAALPTVDVMADRLAARLRDKTPDDGPGWALLGRTYVELKRHPDAAAAFDRALKLVGDDPALLADYADALAMSSNRSLEGAPEALIKRALAADPAHPKALMLMATLAFNRSDFRSAIAVWEKLALSLPAGPDRETIVQNIAEARTMAAGAVPAGSPVPATVTPSPSAAAPAPPPASTRPTAPPRGGS